MTRRDGQGWGRCLFKELWLAGALGVFGVTSLGSGVSGQEDYPLPPIRIDDPDVEKALLQVTDHLKKESEKSEVGEQVIESVHVITRPKESANGEASIGYSFSAAASAPTQFDVCPGVAGPCFDVPNKNALGTKLIPVPPNKQVTINYDFSPAVTVICIGNKCTQL
jgi:hypothetical protein